jgi:HK97 family phage major capsid protein
MSKLKAMLEKKASLTSELRAMSEKLTKESRAWTPEEETKFNELRTEVEAIGKTVDAIQEARELDDADEHEDGEDKPETPEQVEEKENRAFANYIRAVASGKEARADANLTFSDSSNAVVPKTIAKKIVAKIYDISPVADKATKYVTKGTLEIPVYGANSGTDITVAYGTEFTDLESKIGKFGSVELQNFLAGALTKLSNSLINNADVDIVSFVVDRLAYEVSRFIERELLLGTDSKVQGMRTLEAGQIIETGTASVVSADDLVKLKNKVKQAFRNGAIWVMSTSTKTSVELLKDGNERYLFNEDPTGEYDGRIFGYPVYVSDSMPAVADDAKVIYFGNFAGLALKWSEQLEINVLREKYATQHATGIVGWFEFDSKVENNQMLACLTVQGA